MSLTDVVKSRNPMTYHNQFYYTDRGVNTFEVHFVITKNATPHIMAVQKEFSARGAVPGPSQQLEFAGREIRLDIPPNGALIGDGGLILPLTYPVIRKDEVDSFRPGQKIPFIELLIKRHRGPSVERFRAKLIGTKETYNYVTINCHPRKGTSLTAKHKLKMESETLEEIIRDFDKFGISLQQIRLVNRWLKRKPEASWSELCVALERMGERELAHKIRKAFMHGDEGTATCKTNIHEKFVSPSLISVKTEKELVVNTTEDMLDQRRKQCAAVKFMIGLLLVIMCQCFTLLIMQIQILPKLSSTRAKVGFSTTIYAETTVVINRASRGLFWDAYGLNMHFPSEFLSPSIDNISVGIKVTSSSDQFTFPENITLVSAVYWIECFPSCNFTTDITVAIQHYGKSDNLTFVRTGRSDFVFHKLEGGQFSKNTSYGVIDVSHFCGIAVVQHLSGERRYFAGLVYRPVVNDAYSVHFVMSVMLNAAMNHVYRWYSDCRLGSYEQVEFEGDEISLAIDENGMDISGWRILPYNSIIITKHQVENYHSSTVPHACRLQLFWNGAGEHMQLTHRIALHGAKKNHNFVTLDTNDFQTGTAISSVLKKEEQACYLTQHSEDIATIRTWRPRNYELQLMHWKDPSTGVKREFRLKEEIIGSCRKIGTTLGVTDAVLNSVCTDPEQCCDEVLLRWSQGSIPRREEFPVQWGGLINAVYQTCPQVADDLENVLTHRL